MLSAAGVPIKTAVAPQVLEMVRFASRSATYTGGACTDKGLEIAEQFQSNTGLPSMAQAYEGKFECEELHFGQRVSDKVN